MPCKSISLTVRLQACNEITELAITVMRDYIHTPYEFTVECTQDNNTTLASRAPSLRARARAARPLAVVSGNIRFDSLTLGL